MQVIKCILCSGSVFKGKFHQTICSSCLNKIGRIGGIVCNKCGLPLLSENSICLRCRKKEINYLFNKSVYTYTAEIQEIIYQYKFQNNRNLAFFLAEQLYRLITESYPVSVIVPVPGRRKVKKEKGWEHTDLICRILEKNYKLTVLHLLVRKGNKAQKELSLKMRKENLHKSIKLKRKTMIMPENIILVDDIFTTGNTINQCAEILKNAGAEEIYSATIAID